MSSASSKSENVILPMLTFWESREIKPKLEKNLFLPESQDISDLLSFATEYHAQDSLSSQLLLRSCVVEL